MKKRILLLALLIPFIMLYATDVTIKDYSGLNLVVMDFQGSFDQMESAFEKIMQAASGQNISLAGAPYAVYYNNPMDVPEDQLKWAVGVPVPEETTAEAPLKIRSFEPFQAAFAVHTGPYDQIQSTYMDVFSFIMENGYQVAYPAFERYLNNPAFVKPEELKTEIILPVKK